VDASGNIHISGQTAGDLDGSNAGEYDAFLAKFDASQSDTLGDTDGDYDVDIDDYRNFVAQLGGSPNAVENADFNEDGVVNLEDFAIMRWNYGFGAEPEPEVALGATIPEPATLGMLALLGGLTMLRRRRPMC
jgi:hypothetical protein